MFDATAKDTMIDEVQMLLGDRKVLMLTRFGSDLYGTGSADSDTDIRAVFLPTPEEILLGEVNFSLSNATGLRRLGQGDMDVCAYSLVKFLDMLGCFDMPAVEMLFASRNPYACPLSCDPVIDWIYNSRESLIATSAGSPLRMVRKLLGPLMPDNDDHSALFVALQDTLSGLDPASKLIEHLDTLFDLTADPEVSLLVRGPDGDMHGDEALEVMLNKDRPPRTSFFLTLREFKFDLAQPVENLQKQCAKRIGMKEAEKSRLPGGEDYVAKEVYQAMRILDQVIELAGTDEMTFPRGCAPLLKKIKSNELPEAELVKHINFFFQNGIEAAESLSFPKERCLETYKTIVKRTHMAHLLGETDH